MIQAQFGYLTRRYGWDIKRIEITRQSGQSYWSMCGKVERRSAKVTDFERFHETFSDAKEYLLRRARSRIESIEDEARSIKNAIADLERMKETA